MSTDVKIGLPVLITEFFRIRFLIFKNRLIFPVLGILMYSLANDRSIMEKLGC